MTKGKGAITTLFGAIALLLVTATAVWACTPQAPLHILGPAAVGAREKVTAQGSLHSHGTLTAQLRWNSANGRVLASIPNGGQQFSVDITIPEVAPGVYYLLLTSENNTAGMARAAIEVLPPAGDPGAQATAPAPSSLRAVASDVWDGFASVNGELQPGNETASLALDRSPAAPIGIGLVAFGSLALLAGLFLGTKRKTSFAQKP